MYQPWTGGNMDEGWTRWVLEQYEFNLTTLHNADIRAGKLRHKFDAIILPDQNPRAIIDGNDADRTSGPSTAAASATKGSTALKQFVAAGGTLVTLGAASRSRDRAASPCRCANLKRGLTRDQHFAPGHDPQHRSRHRTTRSATAMAAQTYGFYNNSPFFALVEGFASQTLDRRRALSEHRRGRVGLAARRRADGRPRRGRRRST